MTKHPVNTLSRAECAAALREYRRFLADHPDSDLAPLLASTIVGMRRQIKRSRETWRLVDPKTPRAA